MWSEADIARADERFNFTKQCPFSFSEAKTKAYFRLARSALGMAWGTEDLPGATMALASPGRRMQRSISYHLHVNLSV